MKIIQILTILIGITLISSCYSLKRAEKDFTKAVITYPTLGANFCANRYPPKEVVTIEEKEVIRYIDTTSKARTNCDSLRDAGLLVDGVAEIDCHTKIVYKDRVRVEVKEVENTAKIDALSIENDSLNIIIDEFLIKNSKLEGIIEIKNKQITKMWGVIIGIGVLFGLYVFIKAKKVF